METGRYFNFFVFLLILSGIILANRIQSYPFFAFLFIAIAFLVYFFHRQKKVFLADLMIAALIVCLGAALFISSRPAGKKMFLKGSPVVELKVNSLPVEGERRNSFLATVLSIEGRRQNFRVRVFDYSASMQYLKRYRLAANLSRRVYKGRTYYNLWVKKDALAKELPSPLWERAVRKFNSYCLAVFEKNCSQDAKNFLAAVFLGRRELLGQQQVFIRNAGLAHLLAISGLHIGLVSLVLFYFLRFFNLKFKISLLISCFFILFYAAAVGLRASVQRAVIMYLAFTLGFLMQRKAEALNSLGFAGTILLLFSPFLAYDLGFQLSFTAVFGIIAGFKLFPYREAGNLWLNNAKQIFLSSFFVFIFILPLTSFYFGRIYPLSIIYNILLIPLFTAILFLNFMLIALSPLTFIAEGLGVILSWLIHFFQNLTVFLGSLPFSYLSYSFNFPGLLTYYACLLTVFLIVAARKGIIFAKIDKG